MAETQPKAGEYELYALSWDETVSKSGEPYDFVRHTAGDTVTLDAEQARRLVPAGAVGRPGERQRAAVAAAKAAYEAAQALAGPGYVATEPEPSVAPKPDEPVPLPGSTRKP